MRECIVPMETWNALLIIDQRKAELAMLFTPPFPLPRVVNSLIKYCGEATPWGGLLVRSALKFTRTRTLSV